MWLCIFSSRSFEATYKRHSGEKSKKCKQCDYASSQAGDLRRHLKTQSGEKSNKCNQCDYAFSQAGHLRQHMKTHSGGKSNKCNQCVYGTSDRRYFIRDLKTTQDKSQTSKEKFCDLLHIQSVVELFGKNKYYHKYLNYDMCFEKKSEIFLKYFLNFFSQIAVNFQNSSRTRMTVTLAGTVTGNFGVRNSWGQFPTYIRT